MAHRIKLKNEDGTPRPTSDIAAEYAAAKYGTPHVAVLRALEEIEHKCSPRRDEDIATIRAIIEQHAALVARLGELPRWHCGCEYTDEGHPEAVMYPNMPDGKWISADDLARVVKETS